MNAARPTAPAAVRWITRTLEDAGYETWAVGGALRDALLGRPSGDWDLATRATPRQLRKLFRRTVPIGIDHGTVGVLARDGTLYEVTTFRKDVETDGRHAVVEFADSIGDDLARRDFTINAIAWHPLREEFHDPFGGARDLERGVLRTVGAAEERFREDYLRILRALRFAGRFELEIEEATWSALRGLVDHLPSLSPERIREELMKILGSDPRPHRSLELYGESGALRVLYAELEAVRTVGSSVSEGPRRGSSWEIAIATVQRLPTGRADLRLAALLRGLEPEAVAALLMRLRLSNALTDEVARLAGAAPLPPETAPEADVRRWLSAHGVERLPALARLELACARGAFDSGGSRGSGAVVASWRRARAVRRTAPPLTVGDLELDGRGLIGLGLQPGPSFGRILDRLLDWVLEDPARNERSVLEARVLEMTRGDAADV
jgi:tRNA nucleotidyltransferase (CCA-adding enzyme)